jgi:hypothetical protein
MGIQNYDTFIRSTWEWDWLSGAAPRGILPADADGWLEIGGHELILDGKTGQADIAQSFRIAQRKLSDVRTTLLVRGEPSREWKGQPEIREFQIWPSDSCPLETVAPWAEIDNDGFKELFRSWVEWADSNPRRPYVW